jgi:hypothetical protein
MNSVLSTYHNLPYNILGTRENGNFFDIGVVLSEHFIVSPTYTNICGYEGHMEGDGAKLYYVLVKQIHRRMQQMQNMIGRRLTSI